MNDFESTGETNVSVSPQTSTAPNGLYETYTLPTTTTDPETGQLREGEREVNLIKDPAIAEELAYIEADKGRSAALNKEQSFKNDLEQGLLGYTEEQKINHGIMEGLSTKYPNAFKEILFDNGEKALLFKRIPREVTNYDIVQVLGAEANRDLLESQQHLGEIIYRNVILSKHGMSFTAAPMDEIENIGIENLFNALEYDSKHKSDVKTKAARLENKMALNNEAFSLLTSFAGLQSLDKNGPGETLESFRNYFTLLEKYNSAIKPKEARNEEILVKVGNIVDSL